MLDLIGGPLPGLEVIRLDKMRFTGMPPVRFGPSAASDDTMVILYTSGTSGRPKGVMLSDRNLTENVKQVFEWAEFDQQDIMLGVLPQFHSFGLTVLTLLPLASGCLAQAHGICCYPFDVQCDAAHPQGGSHGFQQRSLCSFWRRTVTG
jgi:acyl-CoA synthetase (AMP-forming)/AMP-acid ligase II